MNKFYKVLVSCTIGFCLLVGSIPGFASDIAPANRDGKKAGKPTIATLKCT